MPQEVIDAVFSTALEDTLQKDCSYDVVQSAHEQLRERILAGVRSAQAADAMRLPPELLR